MKYNPNILPKELVEKIIQLNYNYEFDHVYVQKQNHPDLNVIYKLPAFNTDITTVEHAEDEILWAAPTADIILQWLRNEHNININVIPAADDTSPILGYVFLVYTPNETNPYFREDLFKTYEEAVMAGIVYVLTNSHIKDDVFVFEPKEPKVLEEKIKA